MIAGVREIMKRRVLKISLAILIIVGILLGLLVALMMDSGPSMSFGFLDGITLTARKELDPGSPYYRETQYLYLFQADFNDICAKADTELSALGYMKGYDNTQVPHLKVPRKMRFVLFAQKAEEFTGIEILEGHKPSADPAPKSSEYLSLDRNEFQVEDDWISVEVRRTRPRSWPPQYFLHRLKRRFRRASNKVPTKNQ